MARRFTAAFAVAGSGSWASSHSSETNQLPALSRETVSVDGTTSAGSGRDHTMPNGPAVFASVSRPSAYRNALRVYSADARDFRSDLNRGYFDRFPQNAVKAACRCLSACWSGTQDTSAPFADHAPLRAARTRS